MRVKREVTAPLWGCPLGEQLSADRGELHVCLGLMQPEPAALDRQLHAGTVFGRRAGPPLYRNGPLISSI